MTGDSSDSDSSSFHLDFNTGSVGGFDDDSLVGYEGASEDGLFEGSAADDEGRGSIEREYSVVEALEFLHCRVCEVYTVLVDVQYRDALSPHSLCHCWVATRSIQFC